MIAKVNTADQLSIIAGTGQSGEPTPGPATNSMLDFPLDAAVDSSENVYIADTGNDLVEKVTPAGPFVNHLERDGANQFGAGPEADELGADERGQRAPIQVHAQDHQSGWAGRNRGDGERSIVRERRIRLHVDDPRNLRAPGERQTQNPGRNRHLQRRKPRRRQRRNHHDRGHGHQAGHSDRYGLSHGVQRRLGPRRQRRGDNHSDKHVVVNPAVVASG